MTATPTTKEEENKQQQFKHIILNGQKAFEYMTISLKPLLPGIAYHELVYHSIKTGYDITLFNFMADGHMSLEEHRVYGVQGDEVDPSKLFVTLNKEDCTYLKLEDKDSAVGVYGIDIIPFSQIPHIMFDALEGVDGTTHLNSILFRARDDLEGKRR